ncbi:transcription-repair coupling factor [bacterium]|nr:transcription-repair coupling factor [bacterium]
MSALSLDNLERILSLKPGDTSSITGAFGSSPHHQIAQWASLTKRPILIVTSHFKDALVAKDNIEFFLTQKIPVSLFPSLDVFPYYSLSPHPDTVMERIKILWELSTASTPQIVIAPLPALLRKTMPLEKLKKKTIHLEKGHDYLFDELAEQLVDLAYQRTPLVTDRGNFSVRGGLIDIFSPAHPLPLRIEFFGDTIESIRLFDPVSQKTSSHLNEAIILPARETLLSELKEGWALTLKERADALDIPKPMRDVVAESLNNKIYFNGIESFLPLFYSKTESFFDYLHPDTLVISLDPENETVLIHEEEKKLFKSREESASLEKIIEPREIFLDEPAWKEALHYYSHVRFGITGRNDTIDLKTEDNTTLKNILGGMMIKEDSLKPLANELADKKESGLGIYIVASSLSQRERLHDLLGRYNLPLTVAQNTDEIKRVIQEAQKEPYPSIVLMEGSLTEGFLWPEKQQWWITDQEIFGKKTRKAPPKAKGDAFNSFYDLTEGDFVVHELHGVGIYRGLTHLSINNVGNDFLILEYQGGDKLYVPVDQIGRISRFAAQEGSIPTLDKMGGTSWKKIREKVKSATRRLAKELLEIQARRQSEVGYAFTPKNDLYEEFEATFPFDETPDQERAIIDVLGDMETPKPMDRLVCGDVGYGKTEVAIRAAFKCILDHKQVAVLVPTTVLAFQHYETLKKRLEKYPVKLGLLSRFQTDAEQKKIIENLKKGEVDIVVATHRLLSKDIEFRDLGLLVIDEEHRFGVAHKEKMKKLKNLVDVLTLTATPIPRTLNFALVGIRDLSIINTPPADRLSVNTYLTNFDDGTIKEAIEREIKRGGQVYFVHNRVQTILGMKERLEKLIPGISIGVGHGQMEENQLEDVMLGFMSGKFQVLLCTTIVESGLDIPNANTIIINRADHMGLAQLYQLRGRVGRSHQRAYCYLIIPHDTLITEAAKKRLRVIQKFTDLGSGFKIATHDLEIRGAGNILGSEQSGHIASVGYDMYVKLLEEAVMYLQGQTFEESIEPEIKLPVSALIPESLVPDTQMRLLLYKQLSSAKNDEECLSIRDEWMDRLGKLPQETENLIELIRIKLICKKIRILSITLQPNRLVFSIDATCRVPTDYFLNKMKSNMSLYKIMPDGKFIVFDKQLSEANMMEKIKKHLEEMQQHSK